METNKVPVPQEEEKKGEEVAQQSAEDKRLAYENLTPEQKNENMKVSLSNLIN